VGEEGFVLEPLDMTGRGKERVKRKRRLVVDSDKEFPGTQIKAQFQDFRDLLQPKCFPPPTKKAMMWKEMAGCDQLFSRPTAPLLLGELSELVTRNYSTVIPGEVAVEAPITLEEPTSARDADVSKNTTTAEKEVLRDNKEGPTTLNDTTLGETTVPEGEITELPPEGGDNLMMDDFGLGGGLGEDRPFDDVGPAGGLEEKSLTTMEADEPTSRVIPDLPELDDIPSVQSSEEQMSNELSEEFEQRRWTKRTQQVLRVLGRNLSGKESIQFSSLTQRCSRKQAASRFYTCLLLAKEGMIDVKQDGPYADIAVQKGPKFTEVF
jgi:cohesin complex subunit SCC1